MTLPLLGVGLAVAISLARGGRFRHAAETELRWLPLLIAGLLLQTLLDYLGARGESGLATTAALLVVSEACVLGFCIVNWFRPGMVLIAVGFLANAAVILANGGMPVAPEAIRALGGDPFARAIAGKHELLGPATRLRWLADLIPLPPLRLIVSPGDLLLVAGLVPLTHAALSPPHDRDRLGRRARRSDQPQLPRARSDDQGPGDVRLDALVAQPRLVDD